MTVPAGPTVVSVLGLAILCVGMAAIRKPSPRHTRGAHLPGHTAR